MSYASKMELVKVNVIVKIIICKQTQEFTKEPEKVVYLYAIMDYNISII